MNLITQRQKIQQIEVTLKSLQKRLVKAIQKKLNTFA